MDKNLKKSLLIAAVGGLLAGTQGCGGSATPAAETPANEPASDKHSCSAAASKNGCGGGAKGDSKAKDESQTKDGAEEMKH